MYSGTIDLTKEIIRQILNKTSQINRTIWLLMAESGLRGNTVINLRYWQIKDDFEKGSVPMRSLTPAESLKDHVGDRRSFIGEDGNNAFREYLEPRLPLKDNKMRTIHLASISKIFRKKMRALKL